MSDAVKSALPEAAKQLVEEMQRIRYGRIEGLFVRDGLPVFEPRPRMILDHKIGAVPGRRSEAYGVDFKLKNEVLELFQVLGNMGDGKVITLEIQNGLPIRMQMEG